MTNEFAKVYREINIVLKLLGDPFIRKLPKAMIPFFNEQEDKSHNPRITLTKQGFSDNMLTDTYVLLSMMYINYWCDDPDEKQRLKKAWMNPGRNGDYDVFSNDAYKKQSLGVNIATAKYKESNDDVSMQSNGDIQVDENKYANLFDGQNASSHAAINSNNCDKSSNIAISTSNDKFSKVMGVIANGLNTLKELFEKVVSKKN